LTAIILISLPADKKRAGKVLDALVSERLDVRWFSTEPGAPEWEAAKEDTARARCVLFCWSNATRVDAAVPYRELARTAIAAGTAIGIEIDRGALPPDLEMTSYGLYGWRRGDGRLLRYLIGKIFYNDIVSAAKFKAAGRDPSPPSAPTKLLMRQAWVLFVGIGGLLGTMALPGKIHDQIPWPRFNEEKAWAALPSDSCPALAAFIKEYPSGRYTGKAKTIFDSRLRGEARWTPRVRTAPFFIGSADAVPQANESASKADVTKSIQLEVEKVCNGFVEVAGSRLKTGSAKALEWECQTVGGGTVCSVTGSAVCAVEELEEDHAEHCVIPAR
jgi:hypothetical protein